MKKTLVTELVPARDRYVREWITPSHCWYTLPNIEKALGKHFDTMTIRESYPDPRVVCRKSSVNDNADTGVVFLGSGQSWSAK
jgi:hypothetical protein